MLFIKNDFNNYTDIINYNWVNIVILGRNSYFTIIYNKAIIILIPKNEKGIKGNKAIIISRGIPKQIFKKIYSLIIVHLFPWSI